MASRRDLYVGKAGQMAVMAECLLRGYNVAVPEVDVGDDVLVVEDASGKTYRVQVKTSNVRWLRGRTGFRVRFRISLEQLSRPITPELYYVLAARIESGRWEFLVISRKELLREHEEHNVGSTYRGSVSLHFTFRDASVDGYGRAFQVCRNAWGRYWPVIEHS